MLARNAGRKELRYCDIPDTEHHLQFDIHSVMEKIHVRDAGLKESQIAPMSYLQGKQRSR
jgi:hypothetical protein